MACNYNMQPFAITALISLCVQKQKRRKKDKQPPEDSFWYKSANVVLDMSRTTTVQVYSTKADLQMTSCKRIATSI